MHRNANSLALSALVLSACALHSLRSTATNKAEALSKQSQGPRAAPPAAQSPSRVPSAQDPVITEMATRVIGVSQDGQSALILTGGYPGFQHPGRYRRVAITTGATLEEWDGGSLPGLPVMGFITDAERARFRAPATLGADLARVGAQWAGLIETHHQKFAASAIAAVFGVGDALYASDAQGRNVAPLSRSAGYFPVFSPDGRVLAWGEHVGRIPGGVGNYALHIASATDRRPIRIAGGDDINYEQHRFSRDGRALYFTARDEARRQNCFKRASINPVTMTASPAVTILCGSDTHGDIELAISPSRSMALVAIRHRAARSAGTVDLHWIRLADEREVATHTRSGVFVLNGVMDDGLLIARVAQDTVLIDPTQSVTATIPFVRLGGRLYDCAWRNAHELVAHTRTGLRVFRPRALYEHAERAVWS